MLVIKKYQYAQFLIKVMIIALIIVFIARYFFIETYTISSSQMEAALGENDKVFVDKTSYGIRMPITILSIPFVFDSIFEVRSYSDALKFEYQRIFERGVKKNDIVLFNNPLELSKPIDKRSLSVSRCVALPGDTIQMLEGELFIDNEVYMFSPNLMQEYLIHHKENPNFKFKQSDINQILNKYAISLRGFRSTLDGAVIQLSRYEVYMLNNKLAEPISITALDNVYNIDYKVIVPRVGMNISIDVSTLATYGASILSEQGSLAKLKNDTLWIADTVIEEYTFQENYYWLLSDNTTNSVDSHSIGFVPFTHIIGRVKHVWSSASYENTDFK